LKPAKVRRKTTILVSAIEALGHSPSLIKAVQVNEKAEQEMLVKVDRLEKDAARPKAELAGLRQSEHITGQLEKLRSADPVTQERIMRSFIRKVIVDLDKTKVYGSVDFNIVE
jgi:hypothetical protein